MDGRGLRVAFGALIAVVAVALGVRYYAADFTVERELPFVPDPVPAELGGTQGSVSRQTVFVRCTSAGAQVVTESGDPAFFNSESGSPVVGSTCSDARGDRLPKAAVIVLLGVMPACWLILKPAKRSFDSDLAGAQRPGPTTYDVALGDQHRCTCAWEREHQGTRGPCKHILAVLLVTDS